MPAAENINNSNTLSTIILYPANIYKNKLSPLCFYADTLPENLPGNTIIYRLSSNEIELMQVFYYNLYNRRSLDNNPALDITADGALKNHYALGADDAVDLMERMFFFLKENNYRRELIKQFDSYLLHMR